MRRMPAKERYSSTISSDGRVTIPLEIRNRLGLATGDRLDFLVEENRTVIRPNRKNPDPFEKQIGVLGRFPGRGEGTKTWIDDMRTDEK
jgi:AbrB family looped-hinge helix DNA binding protein